jgi:hypothetical protein
VQTNNEAALRALMYNLRIKMAKTEMPLQVRSSIHRAIESIPSGRKRTLL